MAGAGIENVRRAARGGALAALVVALGGVAAGEERSPAAVPAALDGAYELLLETHWSLIVDGGTVGVADRGDVIAYVFAVTNTATAPVFAVTVDSRHAGSGLETAIGSEALINDVPPYNDSTDDTPGDGVWRVLGPGDTVIFAATYAVTQADLDRQ
ncbi:MAG: hypothetical protein BroJett030_24090 [Alphaproteobacteria bacterium]|nr:MAG: hypothetical protein BroJett030_24090 [Alphaproteobacteria bacterium]